MNNAPNPKIDAYIEHAGKWQAHMAQLRSIILGCGLTEELKWGVPCYTFQKKNVVLIHYFKEYCAIMFQKGVLLADADRILIQQTENVQGGRQARFTEVEQIRKLEPVLKTYIFEAIEVEKAGVKVPYKKETEFALADEFRAKLDAMPELKAAFQALTPGRQKGYLLHFSAAKQAKTREARVEKAIQPILNGKGLDE